MSGAGRSGRHRRPSGPLCAVIALVTLAGCSFGAGSAYVGQWKPRQHVEFEACLVDDQAELEVATAGEPRCHDEKQVISERPGRRFWGVILPFPALGMSRVDYAGMTRSHLRAEPSLEVLKGKGRFAVGVRGGALFDAGTGGEDDPDKLSSTSLSLAAIGHASLLDDLGVYGGVGYVTGGVQTQATTERAALGGRVLGGLRLALSKTHSETFIVLSVEIDRVYLRLDDAYQSTGLTGHLGIFF
jgi:hypothetical protein